MTHKNQQTKAKNRRYFSSQLSLSVPLCEGKHVYGDLEALGSHSIVGRACKICSHILYKDQVMAQRKELKRQRDLIRDTVEHIDLFHF